MKLSHKFVENIPQQPEDGILYISIDYSTVIHKCCCGCGNEVVTPLSPADWNIMYNGDTISLYPSIGNWGLACQSHYWIENSQVRLASKWSNEKIETNRKKEIAEKESPHRMKKYNSLFNFFKR